MRRIVWTRENISRRSWGKPRDAEAPRKYVLRMDRTQRGWLIVSAGIFAAAAIVYVFYAAQSVQGPRGGSAIGLMFGILGFACMIFAGLLGARKRVPTWRIGRAQAWMRGHLWLGLLSLPMILFHGGFHFGGTLTRVLMWLLIVTVFSGVFGAALQHYLPRKMTSEAPMETIYDEISHVHNQLREEADRTIGSVCGPLGVATEHAKEEQEQHAGGFTAMRPIAVVTGGPAAVAAPALTEQEGEPLRRFYLQEMRPFLSQPEARGSRLANAERAKNAFAGLKTFLPPAAHATLADMEDICEEARQLVRQKRLHQWLHGWLLVHIPLSLALLVLGAVHAVMALWY